MTVIRRVTIMTQKWMHCWTASTCDCSGLFSCGAGRKPQEIRDWELPNKMAGLVCGVEDNFAKLTFECYFIVEQYWTSSIKQINFPRVFLITWRAGTLTTFWSLLSFKLHLGSKPTAWHPVSCSSDFQHLSTTYLADSCSKLEHFELLLILLSALSGFLGVGLSMVFRRPARSSNTRVPLHFDDAAGRCWHATWKFRAWI